MNAASVQQQPRPCPACPWRTANQGKPHPDGWYTARNLQRLWAGLRRGEDMSCHPTDPRNPVSERAAEAGYRSAPEHADVRECAGALILKQREFTRFQNDHQSNIAAYVRAHPRGLTRTGLIRLVERALFGGALGERTLPRPDLNDSEVSHRPLAAWSPR